MKAGWTGVAAIVKSPGGGRADGLRFDKRSYGIGLALLLLVGRAWALLPPPGETNAWPWLNCWTFGNTNTWPTERGNTPLSFTNLAASWLGNGNAVVLDSTNAAWLQYRMVEDSGTNNLKLDRGSVLFWFAPAWSGTNAGGSGPGDWGRLIEVGQYTTNASVGWWSLYTDPEGVNLYFAAQTNGAEALYFAAPIEWTTNYWHAIALTYSETNTALYLDGALATNGPALTVWPGAEALTNGFFIGSDNTGTEQARGMFDDLATYDSPLEAEAITAAFNAGYVPYYLNPANFANLASGDSSGPVYTPEFRAITGAGWLRWDGAAADCSENASVWLTNVTATVSANGVSVTFEIAGGTNGVIYDVIGTAGFASPVTNTAWAWLGQGQACNRYTIPNLPAAAAYLVLGTARDSDADGLPDAYENLVSKTDPGNPDTDWDWVGDGWEAVFRLNPRSADSDGDGEMDAGFGIVVTQPEGRGL